MWEAIESNRRRSRLLIGAMALILALLGFVVGSAFEPRAGGVVGAVAALGLCGVLWLVATSEGNQIILKTAGAARITKEDAPRLWNVVEEMTIASGLPTPPAVHIIDDDAPNAFATGRTPGTAALAMTSGLASRMNRDELQGVVAHEIGHIVNQDTRFMTTATVMVGSIALISDLFLRNMRFGFMPRRSGRGGNQTQILFLAAALLAAIVAPICAQLLYFACSRRREYLADASAARFTRYPEGLASALEKIMLNVPVRKQVNRTLAPLYIVNPLQSFSAGSALSTHPPTESRIRILRGMGGGASYVDYQAAYERLQREKGLIGARTLGEGKGVRARAATPVEDSKRETIERVREISDLLAVLGGYFLISCPCGVRIKVPPRSRVETVTCPRCGRVNQAERAVSPEGAGGAGGATDSAGTGARTAAPARYERRGGMWESFLCPCGNQIQLSPSFVSTFTTCRKCGRRIEIGSADGSGSRADGRTQPRAGPEG